MFYAAFPPEINSGRMYSGPGSGSMLAAAEAWDGLAAELQSTVASYSSVISSLTSGAWVGPSSLAMAAAVAPYLTWMQGTAAQAAQAAAQATAAASAYETTFAAHVPPPEIAANRSQLASLVANNIFGQNSSAIAATEAQYGEMWAQDGAAMDSYVGSSAAATELTPFTGPPQIANGSGLASQAAVAAQAAGTSAGSAQSIVSSLSSIPNPVSALLQFGAQLATDYSNFFRNILNTLLGPTASTNLELMYGVARNIESWTTQYNWIGLAINLPASQFLKFAPRPGALGMIPREGLGGGLLPHWNRGTLFGAISPDGPSAHWGRGTLVGKLTVPPSWATATPGIRTVAAALSAAGPDAVPAAALGEGSLLSSMSLAGMMGSAFGAGAPSAVTRTGARSRLTPLKDLKGNTSPEKLKRLVAQISEKPESVQHHNVDQEGLDALLEQLSKKPGIHAVHLSKGDKAKVVPSDAQLG